MLAGVDGVLAKSLPRQCLSWQYATKKQSSCKDAHPERVC
jgi:hypothetical protein